MINSVGRQVDGGHFHTISLMCWRNVVALCVGRQSSHRSLSARTTFTSWHRSKTRYSARVIPTHCRSSNTASPSSMPPGTASVYHVSRRVDALHSSLKRSAMARVNEGSQNFTCHRHVYPQMEWVVPPLLPAAARHRTLAGTQFWSRCG